MFLTSSHWCVERNTKSLQFNFPCQSGQGQGQIYLWKETDEGASGERNIYNFSSKEWLEQYSLFWEILTTILL